jgi:hypothetical protein
MAVFCYTVALTAVIKAETLVIRLRPVPKNSALCITARSHLNLRIALRIRNHMQKSFSLLISDPSGID